MAPRYKADVWGSSAWGVFLVEDVDSDRPLVTVYEKREAAEDLALAMNRAAEERVTQSESGTEN